MRRVTLRCPELAGIALRPAQDIELLLREDSGRRVKRRYTIRQARGTSGSPVSGREVPEIDVDVLLHGSGPGARWGADVRPGDTVEFQGPRGRLELRPAAWHLLIGDESALPAIAAIAEALEALPAAEAATALIETTDAADELPFAADVVWVHRGDAEPGGPQLLGGALADVALPAGAGRAYLMGESRAMVQLRESVEARGIAHDAIFLKGYWNRGRPDRLAGRAPA